MKQTSLGNLFGPRLLSPQPCPLPVREADVSVFCGFPCPATVQGRSGTRQAHEPPGPWTEDGALHGKPSSWGRGPTESRFFHVRAERPLTQFTEELTKIRFAERDEYRRDAE